MRCALPRFSARLFNSIIMFILHNRTITERSIVFKRMLFTCQSVKQFGSKTYYNTITVEYPDEGGSFIYYLMPSYRIPLWSKILKEYYLRRYPLSSKTMLNNNLTDINDFVNNLNL